MEEVLLEQVIKKLKGFGLERWFKGIEGTTTYYSINTSNFEIVVKRYDCSKCHPHYDLKIAKKEGNSYSSSSIFFDSDDTNAKNLLADLVHELELKEASKKNYRELLLEGLLEELK